MRRGDRGTVTATLVPSIAGTWHGTFTSINGPVINATANLTQGPADAHGLFPVTGTITFTGSTCFTSGTITMSLFAGEVLGLDIRTNDQPAAGETIFAALLDNPSTASAATGLYQVVGGSCLNDNGNGHITKP